MRWHGQVKPDEDDEVDFISAAYCWTVLSSVVRALSVVGGTRAVQKCDESGNAEIENRMTKEASQQKICA